MIRRVAIALVLWSVPVLAFSQPVGTFRWQTRPFCNVITVAITQIGSSYRLEGTDDQCGGATQASAVGMAFMNPNGTIGLGFSIVGTPGGGAVQVDATITTAAGFSGTWRDNAGRSGPFTFTPGASIGGPVRPAYDRVAFVHTVTALTQVGECTRLGHPLLDEQPGAIVLATHVYVSSEGYLNRDYSVFYSPSAQRWNICNGPAGAPPPPVGHKFSVAVFKQQ